MPAICRWESVPPKSCTSEELNILLGLCRFYLLPTSLLDPAMKYIVKKDFVTSLLRDTTTELGSSDASFCTASVLYIVSAKKRTALQFCPFWYRSSVVPTDCWALRWYYALQSSSNDQSLVFDNGSNLRCTWWVAWTPIDNAKAETRYLSTVSLAFQISSKQSTTILFWLSHSWVNIWPRIAQWKHLAVVPPTIAEYTSEPTQ